MCSYDKPNVLGSRSEHAPTPRDAAGMADELAALLDAAAVPDPYVIVGHSDGGMVAQLFAAAHPDQIAGIVLVDSAHEDQDLRAAELARSQLPSRGGGSTDRRHDRHAPPSRRPRATRPCPEPRAN